MELPLHPQSCVCHVTGRVFAPGERVTSYLVRSESGEVVRHDILAQEAANYSPKGFVFCSWTRPFKPRSVQENSDRALKLTAENLFLTLADPANEAEPKNTPLLQFLALMLERKKLLRPRGLSKDHAKNVYEHGKTHQWYEVPIGNLDEEFFLKIQSELDVLVGAPKSKPA